MRESFIFYRTFQVAIRKLPDTERHALQDAIIDYALDGVAPTFDGYLATIFELISARLDRDRKLYENGTKGGRPKNQTETKTKPNDNQTITKTKPKQNQDETKTKPSPYNININKSSNEDKRDNININNISCKRFVKPTVEEVRDYCQERKNNIDPEAFIDHYEAKGWLIGKQPMKDWRAAVRTWERNHQQDTPQPQAVSSAPQVPEWRILDPTNPNHPKQKEWEKFLEYLDKKNSVLVIRPEQYMKIKVMAEQDGCGNFVRVINDLIRISPIISSVIQEADRLLDLYHHVGEDYKEPINPKSNQKE